MRANGLEKPHSWEWRLLHYADGWRVGEGIKWQERHWNSPDYAEKTPSRPARGRSYQGRNAHYRLTLDLDAETQHRRPPTNVQYGKTSSP